MSPSPGRRAPRWLLVAGGLLAGVTAAHAAQALVRHPDTSATFAAWAYYAVLAGGAAGCLTRAWLVPEKRRPWALIGAGLASWTVGELWIEFGNDSAHWISHVTFLTFYVLALAGLWSLYMNDRACRPGWFWIDAVTGVLTVTAVWATSAGGPILAAGSEFSWGRALDVAYPLLDLLLLVVVVIGLAGRGWRADRATTVLASGLLCVAVADMVYAWQASSGHYLDGTLLDTLWPLGALLMATAAWQPVTAPDEAPMTRETILPALCGVIALTVVALCTVGNLEVGRASLVLALAAVATVLARSVVTSVGFASQTVKTKLSDDRLAEAHRLARFGQWEWDLATNAMTGSDELYRMLELGDPKLPVSFPEMLGRLHEDDRQSVKQTLESAALDGVEFAFETRVVLGDGESVVMAVNGAVDTSGQSTRIFGTAQDITDSYEAEWALHDAETLFRRAFDDAPVGMSLIAPSGRFLRVNSAYREMLGYTNAELSEMTGLELTHPEDVGLTQTFMSAAVSGGPASADFESRRLHRDGRVLDVKGRSSLICDELGAPMYFVTHLEDVTEAKRGRRAIERLASLVNASVDAILSTDADGFVSSWNPAAERLYGYTEQEAMGESLEDLLGEGRPQKSEDTVWEGRDGIKHNLSISASPLQDESDGSAGCSYIVRDITLGMTALAEQRRLEGKLHQAEKLDSLGTLAGGVAHDFNNLLAVIINYADFLIDAADDEQTRADLGEMRSAAERGAQLTKQLLMVTSRGLSRPEVFGLDAHVREVELLLSRTIGDDVEFSFALDADGVNVELDSSELDQVLMNLAVNARHAMPQGGTLRLATSVVGGLVQIEFRDDGVGMTPEVAARAFEPFFTTKEAGTGIGLATVQGVAARAGGRTETESAPDGGTSVRVLLPIAEPSTGAAAGGPTFEAQSDGTGASVLVVEDDAPVREAVRRILASAGYIVSCAQNGEEALGIVLRNAPELVLTDVVMPGMPGTALAQRVHEAAPDTKVVFMSGYSDDTMLRNGLARGDLNLIHKPFDARTLEAAVSAALRQ